MKNKEQIKSITIFLLVIILIIFIGLTLFKKPTIIYEEKLIEDNRAILDSQIYDWGINIYNEKEVNSQYWIYNYGDTQANNIKVKCILYDGNFNIINSKTENIGNLASNSIEFKEMIYLSKGLKENDYSMSSCMIEDCDNCKILWKSIPELKKEYENKMF